MSEDERVRWAITGEDLDRQTKQSGITPFFGVDRSTEVIADNREAPPVLVWWSKDGAEQGTPWRVRHHDGTCSLFRAVRIEGVVDFIQPPEPIPDLPDGPRAVAVLIGGTLIGGR